MALVLLVTLLASATLLSVSLLAGLIGANILSRLPTS
jgi:hypothetical protein